MFPDMESTYDLVSSSIIAFGIDKAGLRNMKSS